MKVTLRHTTDITKQTFSPNQFGDMPKGYKARKFNIDRLRSQGELTEDTLQSLSDIIMLQEGEGDGWTAINKDNLGSQCNSSTWISVQMTIVECLQDVINKF